MSGVPSADMGRILRFDGTVTAGNLLTAGAMAVAMLVWGIRLESRLDHEQDLRSRLEYTLSANVKDLKEGQMLNLIRLENKIGEEAQGRRLNDEDLKAALIRINNKLDALAGQPVARGKL